MARFEGVRNLGKGARGFVQLVVDHQQGDRQTAIKYIPRDTLVAPHFKNVLREVLNHQQLSLCQHPHIVEFYEVFLTPRYLGVAMEFVNGQDLQTYLLHRGGVLPEEVARFIFQQLLLAVDFMHKMGKVNRDIRLQNVLVSDRGSEALPLIKLCNFGCSKDKFSDSAPQTQIGTALFTAPEVFLNVHGRLYEGEAVDVWSCGVILYMMLFGCHPFLCQADMMLSEAEKIVKLVENEVKGQLQVPPSAAGTPVADLLHRILVPAPKQRYTVKDILAHPWFQTQLPPGALELNSSYLQPALIKDMKQTPGTIKQLVQAAAQVARPASMQCLPSPSNAAGTAIGAAVSGAVAVDTRVYSMSDNSLPWSSETAAAEALVSMSMKQH